MWIVQQSLFKDAYVVLQVETGAIGRSRLTRFLQWLDKTGREWTEPDLEEYKSYLYDEYQNPSTVYQHMQSLRAHYVAILSDPANYDELPPAERPQFVNRILERLGYNTISVSYESLLRDDEKLGSENMQVLLPPNSYPYRDTQLVAFITWLDSTGRHWTEPDLLEYKEFMLNETVESVHTINNAISAIRRRYHETFANKEVMATLSSKQRKEFERDMRKRLGYFDQFPSRNNPVREMLEDDPYNQSYLTPHQIRQLFDKPDISTFTGIRDRALLAICIATGIQQFEACGVMVEHLRHDYEGKVALFVPASKQRESRLVPYDEYEWVLDWLDEWLKIGNLSEGYVFRGTYGNRDVLRPHGIAPETASDILSRYPIPMYGTEVPLIFGDLRAACARRWFDTGLDLDEIERRLGTGYRRATLKLIGVRIRKVFTR
jgi:integrase